jgi:hypothetical protein
MRFALAAAAVAAALLATACDRPPQPRTEPSAGSGASGVTQPPRPQTGAPTSAPTAAEKKEGGNPVQGQVDPKQGAQHKDFQQRGDASGPSSAETKPAN